MANLYLNLGINVADLYKNIDKAQLQQIQEACKDGFTPEELKSLEEDGIDVSLIEDNAVEQPLADIKETDSPELQEAKTMLKDIAQNILTESTRVRELEAEVIMLEDEVATEFEKLVDKQAQLEEEQKDEIKEAQAKVQEKFASSEGEMTEEDYQNSLFEAMDEIDSKYGTQFSAIAKDFVENNKKSADLTAKITKQNDMQANIEANKQQVAELSVKITEMQVAQEAVMATANGTQPGTTGSGFYPDFIEKLGEEYKALYKSLYESTSDKTHIENSVIVAHGAAGRCTDANYSNVYLNSIATSYITSMGSAPQPEAIPTAANAKMINDANNEVAKKKGAPTTELN